MPLYQYECGGCGNTMEVLQAMGAIQLCCGKAMVKQISAPLVKIKGAGGFPAARRWYRNWYPGKPDYSTGSLHGEKY